jgi:hypothetical protein
MLYKESIERLAYDEIEILLNTLKEGESEDFHYKRLLGGTLIVKGLFCYAANDKKEKRRTFYFSKNGHYCTVD